MQLGAQPLSSVKTNKKFSRPAFVRAGWTLLAVILVEIGWRLILTTYSSNGILPPSPVIVVIFDFYSHFFPPPVLMIWAARTLSLVTACALSYLFVTSICIGVIRYRTGYLPPMGRVTVGVIYWLVGAIVILTAIRVGIRVPDYIAGNIDRGDFLRAACMSIVVRPDETSSLAVFLLSVMLTTVITPICEELLYRGLLVDAFMPAMGMVPTALLTSALFSLNHFMLSPDLPLYANFFLLGLLFFAARVRFGGVGVPLALHIVVNSFIIFEAMLRC